MKKILIIVLMLALAATIVNDISRYAKARYDLNAAATQTAYVASRDHTLDRDTNAMLAAQFASEMGATVYQFDQTDTGIHVWVQIPIEGTWILGPLMSMASGQDVDTPYYIQLDKTSSYR